MTESLPPLHAQLSALADGELPAQEIGALLDALDADPDAFQWWTAHHATAAIVGGEVVPSASGDAAFWEALQGRLAADLRGSVESVAFAIPLSPSVASATTAANDPWWKSLRLASVTVAVAAGLLATLMWPASHDAQLATVPAPATVLIAADAGSTGASVMLRDPALDALMAAHQQMGGHSAWQAPSGFLRNATFETSGR